MANYTITLPVTMSSNDFGYKVVTDAYFDTSINDVVRVFTEPVAVSDTLTIAYRTSYNYRMGIAWDASQIPKGKEIKSATLHYYTTVGHGNAIYYKFANFQEGSTLPSHEPSDGVQAGGAGTGWGTLDLGIPKGNSIVLYAALKLKKIPLYDNVRYLGTVDGSEMWQIYSHRSAVNKPYVTLTYGDVPPQPPTSLYPSGTTEDPRNIIKFAWVHNSESKTPQKRFELQYSLDRGITWTTITQETPVQNYEMPAGTFPQSGTVTWRIRTTDENDEISEYSMASFNLGIPSQKAPVPISPISQYMDEKTPVTFEWIFTGGSVYDRQAKIDLQYSVDGGTSWATITETTDKTYAILSSGTLTKGNVIWRVRTYNQFGDISPYSDIKSFTVIGSPTIPLITDISNKARPIIKWQTQEQQLYELEILKDSDIIYKTGTIPDASAREFAVPIYLNNGDYTVKIRIANEYSLYSPWAEKGFNILTEKPIKPILTIYNGAFGVTLKTDSELKALVYRDGEYIGDISNKIFADYTGASDKEYKYFIRAIDANDNFADSDIKLGKCRLRANTIAPEENPGSFIKLEYGLDGIPQKNNKFVVDATLQNYDGRIYPVPEYSEFRSFEKSLTFFLESRKEIDNLNDLINNAKTLIYRDTDGEIIIGSVFSLDFAKTTLGYNVSFTIVRTV